MLEGADLGVPLHVRLAHEKKDLERFGLGEADRPVEVEHMRDPRGHGIAGPGGSEFAVKLGRLRLQLAAEKLVGILDQHCHALAEFGHHFGRLDPSGAGAQHVGHEIGRCCGQSVEHQQASAFLHLRRVEFGPQIAQVEQVRHGHETGRDL